MVAVSLWHWWLWVCAGGGCGFVALVAMGLCRWWLWVCGISGCGFVVGMGLVMGLC